MTNYRRYKLKGGTYFFTVNLTERNKTLLTDNIGDLQKAFREVKRNHPFTIEAIVVLPDHLHTIWTLPDGDDDFSLRWRQIKSAFSRNLEKGERLSSSRAAKSERGIWQRRFWEHAIRDEKDYATHVEYIHYNPVKHGYVRHSIEWPYSSFHLFVKRGVYASNWTGENVKALELG